MRWNWETLTLISTWTWQSGKKFGASGVPSLKEFIREIVKSVPSPQGGTVYDRWKKTSAAK
jgi:N-acetylated-alpha-linked acidic dipeptidase